MEHQYSTFHGTSNRDDYGIVQWNSLGPGFHLKIDAFFYLCIDHAVRSNSLLENTELSKGYFAEFENVFVCLVTYFFAIAKDSIIQNLFQKLSILKTERSSSEV